MRLFYTLFEPCDINLFITRNCSVNAGCSVPLAGCCGYYSVALCANTDDKSWCCKSKGVCVSTALAGTAAGEASAIVFILPLFVSPTLPLRPLVPTRPSSGNRTCSRKWAGTNRMGEKDLPRDALASVRRSGVLPLLSLVLCSPEQQSGAWQCVPPSGKMWWVGRETDPFLFFPSVYLRKIYLW